MTDQTPEDKKLLTIVLFGAPGCGKGTQGAALGAVPRFFHFACGDVFRSLETRTPLGQEFISYSSRGKLVPDELTIRLWRSRIDKMVEASAYKPDIDFLVLDGIPRTIEQAQMLEQHLNVVRVFHLSCPDRAELHRRLQKRAIKDNRLDDANEDVIKRRLKTYENESKPLLEFYRDRGVVEIDASQPPIKVLHDIVSEVVKIPEWIASVRHVW
ncbi:MAG: nucleoside monophosphate kinase [Verrucomicrobiae bacterium]|nr:nucleoside monophosphate kinase [Verrucomicrobiae bacterium]